MKPAAMEDVIFDKVTSVEAMKLCKFFLRIVLPPFLGFAIFLSFTRCRARFNKNETPTIMTANFEDTEPAKQHHSDRNIQNLQPACQWHRDN